MFVLKWVGHCLTSQGHPRVLQDNLAGSCGTTKVRNYVALREGTFIIEWGGVGLGRVTETFSFWHKVGESQLYRRVINILYWVKKRGRATTIFFLNTANPPDLSARVTRWYETARPTQFLALVRKIQRKIYILSLQRNQKTYWIQRIIINKHFLCRKIIFLRLNGNGFHECFLRICKKMIIITWWVCVTKVCHYARVPSVGMETE